MAARLLASAADFSDTLRQTIAVCLPALGDFGFFDVVHGDGVLRTVAAHEAPDIEALLATTHWVRQERRDLNLCALSSGEAGLHPCVDDAWRRRVAASDEHLALLRALGFCSMITVPVRYRSELVGGLTLFMGRSGRHHTPDDVAFAAEIALLSAPLVVNARLLEQHRQTEAALRSSEHRLRMALEAGQVGIWDWDIVRDKVTWSDRIYQMHEMVPGADIGGLEGFRSRIHPDDLRMVRDGVSRALAGGPDYSAEVRIQLPGGRIRWINTSSHLVRGPDDRPLRMVGAATDVTERVELLAAERHARAEAEAARRRLELLAGAGAALSRSLDPDETLQAIAATVVPQIADWCRIDLLDESGVLQRRLAYHRDPAWAERALVMARQLRAASDTVGSMAWVLATGRSHYGDFDDPAMLADPALLLYTQTFGMKAHYILPLVARGRTIGTMAVIQAESGRGLTEQDRALVLELGQRAALALDNARLYAEAEAARKQAESANRAKDEFLAMLGHELRNPLAPITTALELMALRDPDASVDERRIIGRQVTHLSRLIEDLLDVSRITQGKVELRRKAVDMRTVVANAVELTLPLFEHHVHPVELRLAARPAIVSGDAVRLTQVLCNLLVNAAKFTPHDGRVTLGLRTEGGFVEIYVEDSGSGIAPQLLPRVFDLFVQGQQAMDRQAGGLGLGLAIVRMLVEMHGGTVSAASEGPGHGSRFTVRLPAHQGQPELAVDTDPAPLEEAGGGRILVVDDNADAASTLAELLQLVGYEVRCAGAGEAALALLDDYVPDLALLDIGLPGMDGYQLARLLRADPRMAGARLVALTGYGRDNDRARALRCPLRRAPGQAGDGRAPDRGAQAAAASLTCLCLRHAVGTGESAGPGPLEVVAPEPAGDVHHFADEVQTRLGRFQGLRGKVARVDAAGRHFRLLIALGPGRHQGPAREALRQRGQGLVRSFVDRALPIPLPRDPAVGQPRRQPGGEFVGDEPARRGLASQQLLQQVGARRQVDAQRLALAPIAGNLEHGRSAQAAVGEQQVFMKHDAVLLVAGFDRDRQRQACQLRVGCPARPIEGQRHQGGAWRNNAQGELARDAVAEIGGADFRDRQAAGGDDQVPRDNAAAVGRELVAWVRWRSGAGDGVHRADGAGLPARDGAGLAFAQQHLDEIIG